MSERELHFYNFSSTSNTTPTSNILITINLIKKISLNKHSPHQTMYNNHHNHQTFPVFLFILFFLNQQFVLATTLVVGSGTNGNDNAVNNDMLATIQEAM